MLYHSLCTYLFRVLCWVGMELFWSVLLVFILPHLLSYVNSQSVGFSSRGQQYIITDSTVNRQGIQNHCFNAGLYIPADFNDDSHDRESYRRFIRVRNQLKRNHITDPIWIVRNNQDDNDQICPVISLSGIGNSTIQDCDNQEFRVLCKPMCSIS